MPKVTSEKQSPGQTTQSFWAPPELPFLELRTTLGSVIPYASHFHRSLSLGLILEGCTTFTCPDESYLAEQGDIVLIEPERPHSCNPVAGQARSYHMLYLDAEWCRKLLGYPQDSGLAVTERILRKAKAFQALCSMLEDIQSGKIDEKQQRNLSRALYELLSAVAIPVAVKQSWPAAELRGKLGREGYIRAFRRKTGMPPGSYELVGRLEKARKLLRAGTPIIETALVCGFADQSHFHRLFVRYFAATPRQYLKNRSLSFKK